MNHRQTTKYNMYVNTKGILQANTALYEPYPIFKENVDLFNNNLDALRALSTEQAQDNTSVTDAKARSKEKMARLAIELAASAMAWAHEQNNPMLLSRFDYSYSDIRFARDIEATSMSTSILQGILENAAPLVEYMVTSEDAEELKASIGEFSDLSESKGAVKSQSVSDTQKLAELIASIDKVLLTKIDKFMIRMQRKEPDFYAAYTNARNIVG